MNNLSATTMTAEEDGLITAYRLSDARGKQAIMAYAKSMSEDWPELNVLNQSEPMGD